MTREEAKAFLISISHDLGTVGAECLSVKDGKKMRDAIETLEQEPCEDAISRPDAIYLADELKDDLPDDEGLAAIVMAHNEGILEYQTKLSLLPPITPKQKIGHWIHFAWSDDCSECGWSTGKYGSPTKYCPNCGTKMGEIDGRK